MKEKQRKILNPNEDGGRPFPLRSWQPTPTMMAALASSSQEESNQSTISTSRKSKRKKSEKPSSSLSGSQSDSSVKSYETVLHRGVIVERNNSFNQYEQSLGKRIDAFNTYLQQLTNGLESYRSHWRSCVLSLKPEYVFK